MSTNLISALEEIESNLTIWRQAGINEEQTSQAIILRVLTELGFNLWNPLEIVAQERAGKDRPDFLLCPRKSGEPSLILEVKRFSSAITDEAVIQTLRYASRYGVRWAIVTNGERWIFCDDRLQGPSSGRVFLTLDLAVLGVKRFGRYLSEVMSKQIWQMPDFEIALEKRLGLVKWELEQHEQLKLLSTHLTETSAERFFDSLGYTVEDVSLIKHRLDEFIELLIQKASSIPVMWQEAFEIALARAPQTNSGSLKVYFGERRVPLDSWASLHFTAAEALIAAKRDDKLAEIDFVRDTPEGQGAYPPSVFRQLSNGRHLLLKAAAQTHRSRINRLFKALGVPNGRIEVWYGETRYLLPTP